MNFASAWKNTQNVILFAGKCYLLFNMTKIDYL